jgi:uncharacterized protein (TIGR03066 family)
MNARRLLAAGLLGLGLLTTLAAEEKKDDTNKEKLVGIWEVVKAEQGALPVGSVVDFGKDGKAKVTAVREGKESTAEGSYSVEGDKLTVTLKHGEKEVKHAITIKKLTDTEFVSENEKGKTAQFKRKK